MPAISSPWKPAPYHSARICGGSCSLLLSPISSLTTLVLQIDRLFIFKLKYRSARCVSNHRPGHHRPVFLFHSNPLWGISRPAHLCRSAPGGVSLMGTSGQSRHSCFISSHRRHCAANLVLFITQRRNPFKETFRVLRALFSWCLRCGLYLGNWWNYFYVLCKRI